MGKKCTTSSTALTIENAQYGSVMLSHRLQLLCYCCCAASYWLTTSDVLHVALSWCAYHIICPTWGLYYHDTTVRVRLTSSPEFPHIQRRISPKHTINNIKTKKDSWLLFLLFNHCVKHNKLATDRSWCANTWWLSRAVISRYTLRQQVYFFVGSSKWVYHISSEFRSTTVEQLRNGESRLLASCFKFQPQRNLGPCAQKNKIQSIAYSC